MRRIITKDRTIANLLLLLPAEVVRASLVSPAAAKLLAAIGAAGATAATVWAMWLARRRLAIGEVLVPTVREGRQRAEVFSEISHCETT